jgi:hypothetical protein
MAKKIYTLSERKKQFLQHGVTIARKVGVDKLTASAVAAKAKVSAPMVFKAFGSRDALRRAVQKEMGFKPAAKKVAAKKSAVSPAKPAAAPARKRSIKEVKAIKDKAAGKRKVSRSAKDGKFVDKATVKANPATTVTQTVKAPRKPKVPQPKYQPAAEPTNLVNQEPKATI